MVKNQEFSALPGKVRENKGLPKDIEFARTISASLSIHLYERGTLESVVLPLMLAS